MQESFFNDFEENENVSEKNPNTSNENFSKSQPITGNCEKSQNVEKPMVSIPIGDLKDIMLMEETEKKPFLKLRPISELTGNYAKTVLPGIPSNISSRLSSETPSQSNVLREKCYYCGKHILGKLYKNHVKNCKIISTFISKFIQKARNGYLCSVCFVKLPFKKGSMINHIKKSHSINSKSAAYKEIENAVDLYLENVLERKVGLPNVQSNDMNLTVKTSLERPLEIHFEENVDEKPKAPKIDPWESITQKGDKDKYR